MNAMMQSVPLRALTRAFLKLALNDSNTKNRMKVPSGISFDAISNRILFKAPFALISHPCYFGGYACVRCGG